MLIVARAQPCRIMTRALSAIRAVIRTTSASIAPKRMSVLRRIRAVTSQPAQTISATMTQIAPTPNSPVLSLGTSGVATSSAARPASGIASPQDGVPARPAAPSVARDADGLLV